MNRAHTEPSDSGSPPTSPVPGTRIERAITLAWTILVFAALGSHRFVVRAAEPLTPAQVDFFEKRIRPFLANDCYECHGAEKQKGGLRLDSRSALLKGGDSGPAVVPGDATRSLLIQAIRHEHADTRMPKDRPKLSDSAIGSFVQWVNEGAPDPRDHPPVAERAGAADWESVFQARREWWSLQPLKKPLLPAVKDVGWSGQPVDRFILAALEGSGIRPALPASPTTWLRRVHFVITGLPPTQEELRVFLEDTSQAGRARVLDRLLASPHYGERWARHWMDLVRFAETYGHEQDFDIPHAWRYRDYLIRAFNADVPYDQFVKEHVAGDLLQPPRRHPTAGFNESIIGTGWWHLHQATHAPVDPALDEADHIDNQVDVFSKTFLGLTVACARCHDHKFDAISTRDYYSLTAYLRGSRQQIASLDPDGTLEPRVEELRQQHGRETGNLREALKRVRTADGPGIAAYLSAAREVLHGPARPADVEANGRADRVFEDFEDGTYARWKVEGTAFGTEPAAGKHPNQQAVEGFQGRRLANSFTQGDAPKGTLRSLPFEVTHPYLRFLLGGGIPSKKARIALRVEGREVREASGQNRERLEPRVWDVREFAGKTATLELIDDDDSTWGHINVDDIVFTDSPDVGQPRHQRPIAAVARERGLSTAILDSWMTELTSDGARKPSHPLRAWLAAVEREHAGPKTPVPPAAVQETGSGTSSEPVHVPFPAPDFQTWFPSGQAFGLASDAVGRWRVEGSGIELLPPGIAHSGRFANPLQGTLRSPTFTITHSNIHLRVAGRSGQVRLIISRYGLREFNPLLFEQTLFDVNTDGGFTWHSITAGLHRHIGRPAYLELIDRGDGFVALDRIVFSTGAKPPADAPWIATAPDSSSAEIAAAMEAVFRHELDAWINPGPEAKSVALLSWLTRKQLVDWGASAAGIASIASQISKASEGLPQPLRVLAMTDGSAEPTRVFVRGDPRTPGTPVSRRVPEAMACPTAASTVDRSGRLELAESLLAECNPLTYRVIVNRVWAHVFGRGLVATVDNLGTMGQVPSHPELLDHLALTFRSDGGSLKRLIRTLCLTQTFQMSSVSEDPVAKTRDPENALLHRMRLRRLEGEAIRDSLLLVSGQLNRVQFGPSVPTYLTPFMGDRMWVKNASGPLDGDRRRSIYLETRRNFLSTWMLTFDLPLPDTTVGLRNRSNVPGQALALMNDPLVQQLATAWARESLKQSGLSHRERIEQLFLRALTRPPKEAEVDRMLTFLQTQASARPLTVEAGRLDPELWTDACHVVFMMKEFIHVP
jgi:hypothetical protein